MSKLALIEDDPTMVSLLKMLLELEGFQVIGYAGEELSEIITMLQCERPDSILLDVNLRHFNGLELIHQIRLDPQLNSLHVIMTSGLDLQDECLTAGASAFIMKPYMPDDLMKLLKN
jgi:DNA-binding response OmpR family regulator